jgi:hypothetical protein
VLSEAQGVERFCPDYHCTISIRPETGCIFRREQRNMRRQEFCTNEATLSRKELPCIGKSEHCSYNKGSNKGDLALFTVPVISSFEVAVPESQFEVALQSVFGCRSCGDTGGHLCHSLLQRKLCPYAFAFDHLSELPTSPTSQDVASLFNEFNRTLPYISYLNSTCRYKRSTTFLRYFVGAKGSFFGEDSGERAKPYSALRLHLKAGIERQIGLECKVELLFKGSFLDSLYTGMWLYQCKRLEHLIHRVILGNGRGRLVARIAIVNQFDHCDLRVGFFVGSRPVELRDYLLRTRPRENVMRCIERLTKRFITCGIHTVISEGGKLDTCRHERSLGFWSDCPRIAVPI